jgi:hypothetical protein
MEEKDAERAIIEGRFGKTSNPRAPISSSLNFLQMLSVAWANADGGVIAPCLAKCPRPA